MLRGTILFLMFLMFLMLECGTVYCSDSTFIDVFPLKKKLHYSYDYFIEYGWIDMLIPIDVHVDSGTVEYIVRDSSRLNDTVVIWNIEERSNLLHKVWWTSGDSTYWASDTVLFPLYESTIGYHSLQTNNITLGWSFLNSNALPIYRYATNDTVTSSIQWSEGPPFGSSGADTVWQNDIFGFFQRVYHDLSNFGNHSYSYTDISVRASRGPILDVGDEAILPLGIELSQNYPNPFNPMTTIELRVAKSGFVSLVVYDLLGREVATLVNENMNPGTYNVSWNAGNLASGVYIYKLTGQGFTDSKKLMLIR